MKFPILGPVYSYCHNCGSNVDSDILSNFFHDFRCWGVKTALLNARTRLNPPDWFLEE